MMMCQEACGEVAAACRQETTWHDSCTACEDNCLHQSASAAHGDESRWIDTSTVAGYRRVVMCQEARDEVEAALPPGADPAPLLLSMCTRRLLPTPWLNKVLTPVCRIASRPCNVLGAASTQPKGANGGLSHALAQKGACASTACLPSHT